MSPMLSLFPNLLDYALFSPLLLRLVLAFFLTRLAIAHLKKPDTGVRDNKKTFYGSFEMGVAFFLAIGLFTQAAALLAIVIVAFHVRFRSVGTDNESRMLALLFATIVAITLLFTGAGFFAFDLPL